MLHLYTIRQIGIQPKMIIYGEIKQIQMKLENDHVKNDIMYQLKQNGHEYIQHDDGELID